MARAAELQQAASFVRGSQEPGMSFSQPAHAEKDVASQQRQCFLLLIHMQMRRAWVWAFAINFVPTNLRFSHFCCAGSRGSPRLAVPQGGGAVGRAFPSPSHPVESKRKRGTFQNLLGVTQLRVQLRGSRRGGKAAAGVAMSCP